jgi:hypothetical protein
MRSHCGTTVYFPTLVATVTVLQVFGHDTNPLKPFPLPTPSGTTRIATTSSLSLALGFCGGSLRRREGWQVVGEDAELVFLRIGHRDPAPPAGPTVICHLRGTERD